MSEDANNKRKLTVENVEELRAFLRTVPPPRKLSSRDAVAAMTDEVAALQANGYTLADIGKMVEDQGFDLPISTFRNYLQQVGYKRNTPLSRQSKRSTAKRSNKRSASGKTR